MSRKRTDDVEVSPELLARIDDAFGDFSEKAARDGVPLHEFEAQLAAILNRAKQKVLAKRAANTDEGAQE